MPATAADIAAGTRRAKIVTWSDSAIKTRYPGARDGASQPAEGMCDSATDAQTLVDFRGALFGTERRRFVAEAQDLLWPDLPSGIPIVMLTDSEQSISGKTLPARIEISGKDEATRYELFG